MTVARKDYAAIPSAEEEAAAAAAVCNATKEKAATLSAAADGTQVTVARED